MENNFLLSWHVGSRTVVVVVLAFRHPSIRKPGVCSETSMIDERAAVDAKVSTERQVTDIFRMVSTRNLKLVEYFTVECMEAMNPSGT